MPPFTWQLRPVSCGEAAQCPSLHSQLCPRWRTLRTHNCTTTFELFTPPWPSATPRPDTVDAVGRCAAADLRSDAAPPDRKPPRRRSGDRRAIRKRRRVRRRPRTLPRLLLLAG